MKRAGKPKKTAFERTREKANAIRDLISSEKDRHARKTKSLSEQIAAARRFVSDDLRNLALIRLEGQRLDEIARHQDRKRNLETRLQKTLK